MWEHPCVTCVGLIFLVQGLFLACMPVASLLSVAGSRVESILPAQLLKTPSLSFQTMYFMIPLSLGSRVGHSFCRVATSCCDIWQHRDLALPMPNGISQGNFSALVFLERFS